MENNKNKKSVKFQGDMLNFYDFIQVFVFTTNHHLNTVVYSIDTMLEEDKHMPILWHVYVYIMEAYILCMHIYTVCVMKF